MTGMLDGKVAVTVSGEIRAAVISAYQMAKDDGNRKPVVLLSPACASFDQYPNFELRGEAFRTLVSNFPAANGEAA